MQSNFFLDPHEVLSIFEKKFKVYTTGYVQHLSSLENRVFEIEIENLDGTKTRKVTKFYRPGRWTKEMVKEELDFTFHLAQHDIDVILPDVNQEGEYLFTTNEIHWACFPKKGGYVHHELNEEQVLSLGRCLGKLHQASRNFKFNHRITFAERLSLDESFEKIKTKMESDYFKNRFSNLYLKVLPEILREIQKENYPIHGDLHASNCLWPKENHVFLLDFDDSCLGPYFQDVWMLIHEPKDFYLFLEGYEEFGKREWLGEFSIHRRDLFRLARMLSYWAWLVDREQDPYVSKYFTNLSLSSFWEAEVNAWCTIADEIVNSSRDIF